VASAAVGTRYTNVAVALHWTIALLLIANIGLAWTFKTLPQGLAWFRLIQLHKSVGITVLLLSLARLGWRIGHPAPPYPPGLAGWRKAASKAVQWAFYAVMIGMPLTGWIMVSASRYNLPTLLYGAVPWPHLGFVHDAAAPVKQGWDRLGHLGHGALAWLAYGLIVLHVGAALEHQFVSQDAVMGRMTPTFRRRPT